MCVCVCVREREREREREYNTVINSKTPRATATQALGFIIAPLRKKRETQMQRKMSAKN